MANAAAGALQRVVHELQELEAALQVAPVQSFSSEEAGGRSLRDVLELAAAKIAHETTRFALVVRATSAVTAANIAEVAVYVQEAAATFTSAVQLYTAEGACGRTLRKTVRDHAKSLLRATREAVNPVVPTPVAGASLTDAMVMANRGRAGAAVLSMTGLVSKLAEGFPRLPTSDVNAVRGVVLEVAKLVKTSITEVAEEHNLRPGDADAPPPAPAPGGGEGGDDDDEDDDEDGVDSEGELSPEQQEAIVRAGLRALSATMKAVRAVFMGVEAVARAPPAAATSTALVAASGAPAALAPGAGDAAPASPPTHPFLELLDDVATLMGAAEEAVIDVAAAVNEVEVEAVPDAVRDLESALSGVDRRLSSSVSPAWESQAAEVKAATAGALESLAALRRAAGAATRA